MQNGLRQFHKNLNKLLRAMLNYWKKFWDIKFNIFRDTTFCAFLGTPCGIHNQDIHYLIYNLKLSLHNSLSLSLYIFFSLPLPECTVESIADTIQRKVLSNDHILLEKFPIANRNRGSLSIVDILWRNRNSLPLVAQMQFFF